MINTLDRLAMATMRERTIVQYLHNALSVWKLRAILVWRKAILVLYMEGAANAGWYAATLVYLIIYHILTVAVTETIEGGGHGFTFYFWRMK